MKTKPTKAEWAALRVRLNLTLDGHREVFDQFSERVGALFREKLEALQTESTVLFRKPAISLRLIVAGDPAAKLIVMPHWIRPTGVLGGRLLCDLLTLELWTESPVMTAKGPGVQLRRKLTVRNRNGGMGWLVGSIFTSAEADALRVVDTLRDFVTDARAVLARNRANCCVCGRALTDELSRSRGVGPECVKGLEWFAFLASSSVTIQAAPDAAEKAGAA